MSVATGDGRGSPTCEHTPSDRKGQLRSVLRGSMGANPEGRGSPTCEHTPSDRQGQLRSVLRGSMGANPEGRTVAFKGEDPAARLTKSLASGECIGYAAPILGL